MACIKTNLGKVPPAVQFRLDEIDGTVKVAYLGRSDTTANDLVADPMVRTARTKAKSDAVEKLIRTIGADGRWHRSKELESAVENVRGSVRTIKRVKKNLGVVSKRQPDGARDWWWYLPKSQGARSGGMSNADGTLPPSWPPTPDDGTLRTSNNNYLDSQDTQRVTKSNIATANGTLPANEDFNGILPCANDYADLDIDFNGDVGHEEDAV